MDTYLQKEFDNKSLKNAVNLWIENENQAIEMFGDISTWDVSNVTDMRAMFTNATSFNGDLSNWDVSNVTDMLKMFYNATSFNGDLSNWDVSKVKYMQTMFAGA